MKLCRNRQCVARQLTACPSANTEECSGNGVRDLWLFIYYVYLNYIQVCNDLNQCSCNPDYTGTNCSSLVNEGGGRCG